jgi:hypothetical protein
MKKTLFALFVALLAATSIAQAMTREEAEAKCRIYAQEDGISSEEMKDYIAQCVEDLMQAGGEESGGAANE